MASETEIFRQLMAFRVFKTQGLDAVRDSYPEYVDFVEANQDKTHEAVQEELMGQLKATA